jgi:hypothetical protein
MLIQSLGGRRLWAFRSSPALVLAAVVLSGALGAGTALLVAGRVLDPDVASIGPGVDVRSSGGSLIASRTATSENRSALAERDGAERPGSGEPTAGRTWPRTTGAVLEQQGDAAAVGAGQEGVASGEPSQSEQAGASEPPTGPSPGVPVENEEPSEEGPGDDGDAEPPEEQPAPPEEETEPEEDEDEEDEDEEEEAEEEEEEPEPEED